MGRRGCASAMGMIKFPSSCSSPKALCNQFIDYYICSRGVFCINHIKLRNFVVITIECSIATVDRGSIMTRIYRWSMMVYSSLQAEFMVTKYDGHIHIWYIIIIKSEVSTFPIVIIFSVVVCLRCLLHHSLSRIAYTFRENWDFVLLIIVQFMMSANSRMRYGLQTVIVVCTLHHLIIMIVQTYICTWSETYFRQDLFPAYLFFRRQFHAIVIFRFKSSSDLDSGSLPRFFGEFIYAKLKIVAS